MSIRLNNRSSSRTQISQSPRPSSSKLDSQLHNTKSQSGSRTRSYEPKPRPSTSMESPTATPTARKPRRHNKGSQRPEQREPVPALQPDNESDQEASSDEELIYLIGSLRQNPAASIDITPDLPKKGGLLAITKADITQSETKKGRSRGKKAMADSELEAKPSPIDRKTPGKRGAKKSHAVEKGFDVTEAISEIASQGAGTPTRKGKGSKINQASKPSGLASTLAANKQVKPSIETDHSDMAHFDMNAATYDMSILSKSLPHQNDNVFGGIENRASGRKGKGKSDAWDMPAEVAAETPTWQQQLGSRGSKGLKLSRASERELKPAPSAFRTSRPEHNRRKSTDGLPLPSHPNPPRSAPPLAPSAFDQDGSYHIGFNVNRAPQTPSKSHLREALNNESNSVILGEFPRPNKLFDNVLKSGIHPNPQGQSQSAPESDGMSKSVMYAGPISHYSPHARTLAKPDQLDEF